MLKSMPVCVCVCVCDRDCVCVMEEMIVIGVVKSSVGMGIEGG